MSVLKAWSSMIQFVEGESAFFRFWQRRNFWNFKWGFSLLQEGQRDLRPARDTWFRWQRPDQLPTLQGSWWFPSSVCQWWACFCLCACFKASWTCLPISCCLWNGLYFRCLPFQLDWQLGFCPALSKACHGRPEQRFQGRQQCFHRSGWSPTCQVAQSCGWRACCAECSCSCYQLKCRCPLFRLGICHRCFKFQRNCCQDENLRGCFEAALEECWQKGRELASPLKGPDRFEGVWCWFWGEVGVLEGGWGWSWWGWPKACGMSLLKYAEEQERLAESLTGSVCCWSCYGPVEVACLRHHRPQGPTLASPSMWKWHVCSASWTCAVDLESFGWECSCICSSVPVWSCP